MIALKLCPFLFEKTEVQRSILVKHLPNAELRFKHQQPNSRAHTLNHMGVLTL